MSLKKQDKEFNLNKITYLEYKYSEIERTFLNLFPRLKFDGYLGKVRKGIQELTLDTFTAELTDLNNQTEFIDFQEYPEIIYKWLETDLLDLVNRGRATETVASFRPLHGNVYKYRNARHARDYGTSQQVFWMLYHGGKKGQAAKNALKDFLFTGWDANTDKIDLDSTKIDVETQVILHFDNKAKVTDRRDEKKEPDRYPPVDDYQSQLLADDLLRLLTYEDYMPRSVLVDYLKTLISFHLALYHLRLLKLLPCLTQNTKYPHPTGIVLDLGDPHNHQMRDIARRSADYYYRSIPAYIEAHFTIKKLDEMASYLQFRGKLSPSGTFFTVPEILELLKPKWEQDRENFFDSRLVRLRENFLEVKDGCLPPEAEQIYGLNLSSFDTYIEILVALRGSYNNKYIIQSLDALMLKNKSSGLLSQPVKNKKERHFVLGSRLLEVLLQVAVLEPDKDGFKTREIRLDNLLDWLRERYGLHIDRFPNGSGFGEASIKDRQALRKNLETFKTRLREIGFFQDLSDAYITQTVTPRYTITR